jgi:hypothetical protein
MTKGDERFTIGMVCGWRKAKSACNDTAHLSSSFAELSIAYRLGPIQIALREPMGTDLFAVLLAVWMKRLDLFYGPRSKRGIRDVCLLYRLQLSD